MRWNRVAEALAPSPPYHTPASRDRAECQSEELKTCAPRKHRIMKPAAWIRSGLPPSIEYLAGSELFRQSTYNLVDMTGAQLNWPKYLLLGHAIELALKAVTMAFEERTGKQPIDPMPRRHDLLGYYEAAVRAGMRQLPFNIEGILQELAELHEDHMQGIRSHAGP
jgi:hypothetical protein